MTAGSGFRIVATRLLTETPFLRLEEVDLETPDGGAGTRTVIRIGGAVSVVPVVDDEVVLIRQYRTPLGRPLLEIPAGKLDIPGEDPRDAAARELAEEAGYVAGHLELVSEFYTSPGFVDERMSVFIATELSPVDASPMGPEELAAEIVRIPIADLPGLMRTIEDGKTLVGLMALLLSRGAGGNDERHTPGQS
ncbi:MAG: NUDIX hydrolase [Actinomycetota bacterium]|nr:NUDIX hydrolase [Actinomycetota bacterium]